MGRVAGIALTALIICGVTGSVGRAEQFTVKPDSADFIVYGFGGGEAGADWGEVTVRGNGLTTYRYAHSYWERKDYQVDERVKRLSMDETKQLFQTLLDAGIFDLPLVPSRGADISTVWVRADVDGHRIDSSIDYTDLHKDLSWRRTIKVFEPLLKDMRGESEPEWLFPSIEDEG